MKMKHISIFKQRIFIIQFIPNSAAWTIVLKVQLSSVTHQFRGGRCFRKATSRSGHIEILYTRTSNIVGYLKWTLFWYFNILLDNLVSDRHPLKRYSREQHRQMILCEYWPFQFKSNVHWFIIPQPFNAFSSNKSIVYTSFFTER